MGCGPRGLSALESVYKFYNEAKTNTILEVLVFESTNQFGNGRVYSTSQVESNWLNISNRALTLNARKVLKNNNFYIREFPSYHDWINFNNDDSQIDVFSSRADIGKYLHERFKTIKEDLEQAELIQTFNACVERVKFIENEFSLITNEGLVYKADEVVLTIGHQPTNVSPQLKKWQNYVSKHQGLILIKEPYPIRELLESESINASTTIALRGFGLAMIDVARALVVETDGSFEITDTKTQAMICKLGKNTPRKIIPFSLDGLPMSPKPLNAIIDRWFMPSDTQLQSFANALKTATNNAENTNSSNFLVQSITPLISEIFLKLGDKSMPHELSKNSLNTLIENWILNNEDNHNIFLQATLSTKLIMKRYVEMATGTGLISLEYCIGQVWRHCQPTMYSELSFTNFSDEVISKIVNLDEKYKRLTFGPPVASIQQLLAMIDAGIMSLKIIQDPDIKCSEDGWVFDPEDTNATAQVMINTVLDAPKILEVNSPIIINLLQDDHLQPINSKLGLKTYKNGIINLPNTNKTIPISLLGRLAKGSIIGVDAMLECFGSRIDFWAKGVINRFPNK